MSDTNTYTEQLEARINELTAKVHELAADNVILRTILEQSKAADEVVDAQLAERNADVERLIVRVRELEAWKDAVPVDALERYWTNSTPTTYPNAYDDVDDIHEWFQKQNGYRQ